ncbi:hypothetical protein BHYA_0068g00010 [Botrytis hyacinthi]|uniref:DUF7918 domain-containing protein n=1 Tax=Botrytis hyacinthi TaxID=278943 RepID=A0A4Z1GUQ8_9HELO|nr:hypothetical protein BHYA_0068g00010 [Botrytis hyacinthi]
MAVLDSLPGIEVAVCVDGEPLNEYENTEDELMLNEPEGLGKKFEVARHQRSVTVKKFVESTAGKFFTIKCSVKTPYRYAGACTHISFCSSIDGENLSWAPLFNKETYEKSSSSLTREVEGNFYKEEGKLLLQRLQFTETHLTQWDNSIESGTRLDGNGRYVGEIEVRVFREMSPSKTSLVSTAPLVSKTSIPENLLKGQAKSHSTLGDPEALGVIGRMPEPEPESSFGLGHDFEPLPMPMSEARVPVKLFRDTIEEAEAEAKLSNKINHGGSTADLHAIRLTPPSIKHEVQDAKQVTSASWNFQDLDPTQTGQLFGQFLQYLQTQGSGQPSHAPPPLPVGTAFAALPGLPTSTSSNEVATTATPQPPVKREKERNRDESRKRRRKVRGKVTIDLTEDDSDDDVVIDLDSD